MFSRIVLVKASDYHDVRLQKYVHIFKDAGVKATFWGLRDSAEKGPGYQVPDKICYMSSLRRGGKVGRLFGLVWFLVCVFFRALFSRQSIYYCADFEAAVPVIAAALLRPGHRVIYDVYDEVDLRYSFAPAVAKILRVIDGWAHRRAKVLIVVSDDRAAACLARHSVRPVVIENKPAKHVLNVVKNQNETGRTFAVIGYLAPTRGIRSICGFARDNPDITFIFAGRFTDDDLMREALSSSNCEYLGQLSQLELFRVLGRASAVFSLYDPRIEINVLAASNKLFDAMAFEIPIIVNNGIKAADYVAANDIGFVVPYDYDQGTWSELVESDDEAYRDKGARGKAIFDVIPSFEEQVHSVIAMVA